VLAFCVPVLDTRTLSLLSRVKVQAMSPVVCRRALPGVLLVLLIALVAGLPGAGKEPPVERLRPVGIDGALVICGGGKVPDAALKRFVELAGGEKAKLVLIPTASESADKEDAQKLVDSWKDLKPASVTVLHTRERKKADDAAFLEPLRQATGVWFEGGDPSRLTEAYLGTGVEKELYALQKRGGVIGGTSAGAAVMTKVMIAGDNPEPRIATGFDLLPGAVVDQHLSQRERLLRLMEVLKKHPDCFGVGIDDGTALVVRGRELRVLGEGQATFCLAAGGGRSERTVALKSSDRFGSDLTMWRRAALGRLADPSPLKPRGAPEVKSGSLVIVGGGGLPADIVKKMIELAGGPDEPWVVLPTANPDPLPESAESGFLKKAGVKTVNVLRARELKDVEDPKNLEVLSKAKGVWFGGGRQWRFVDAYEGTKAQVAFFDVLKRGGVIGGSSAGATIQGDYLCRGSPLGNLEMMCEGYERGLAFLPGVAIDQHFSQRKRHADMTALMKAQPQFLGIGLDEATAIVVQGHVAHVMGNGKAHFYDTKKHADGKQDYEALPAGQRYDLGARKSLEK
jgi:cyanophycinase